MKVEIEIPIAELKPSIIGLTKVIPRSTTLPILQCVKVKLQDNTVSIQAHNLDEIATLRIPHTAQGCPGELLVPFDTLSKIIKSSTPKESVRLISNGEETKIRYLVAGSAVDRLVSHFSPSDWPEVKQGSGEGFSLDASFKEALRESLECGSVDSSRYVLNGTCIDVTSSDGHYLVGTDGRHLYACNSFQFSLPESVILPSRRFITWPGFMNDGAWQLRVLPKVKTKNPDVEEPAWFEISSDNWTYTARSIDGKYPNWKHVMPVTDASWTEVNLGESAVETILQAVPMMPGAEDTDQPITLVAGNGLCLKAKGSGQHQWTHIPVPGASVVGASVDIALNRVFLLRALRFGLNRFHIHSPIEPLVFSTDRKKMVVMPLRCEAEPAPDEKNQAPNPEPAAPPSPAEVNTPTEERNNTVSTNAMTAPERNNLPAHNRSQEEKEEPRSAFKSALEQIDDIKSSLREVIGGLGEAVAMLKAAEKEQRASAREIELVRAKLREIQSVEI